MDPNTFLDSLDTPKAGAPSTGTPPVPGPRRASLSPDEFLDQLEEPKPAASEDGDFKRGFTTAFQQLPQLSYGVMAGAGAAAENALGEGGIATGVKKAGIAGYKEWGDKIAAKAKPSDEWDYSWNQAKEGDFGALADWIQHGLGYVGGQALQTLATGGLGAIAARGGAKMLGANVAEGLVKKEAARLAETGAAKGMTTEALNKAATANVAQRIGQIGQTAGVGVGAVGMEGGEIFGDLTSENADRALTGSELAKAFGATVAAGGLEFVGDKVGLDLMLGKSRLLKPAEGMAGLGGRAARAGIAAAGAAPIEAGTEFGQTLIEEYGKGKDPFSPEAFQQAGNAAALGALGGTAVGGAAGALRGPKAPGSIDAATEPEPLALGNTPDPMIAFPDGTVGKRSDVDNYLNGLPEDQRAAMRAKLMGMAPQEATDPVIAPIKEIAAAGSVDEAIEAATAGLDAALGQHTQQRAQIRATQREAANDDPELDALIESETRNLQVARAQAVMGQMKRREEAAIVAQSRQALGKTPAQQMAVGAAASELGQPTAMQLAMERARMKSGKTGSQPGNTASAAPESEWQAFTPETGTKGIPRSDMPQIKSEHRGAMVNFMNARGVAHQEELVEPGDLKPTQAEYSTAKVQQAKDYVGGNRAILVSQDGHVLDGHHQWLAAKEAGTPVRAIRLGATIERLVGLAREFPSSTTDTASAAPAATQTEQPTAVAPQNAPAVIDQPAAPALEAENTNAAPSNAVEKPEVEPAPRELDARYGRDGQALSEGGKPFKHQWQAQRARRLQPHLKVAKVDGGFALREKTDAELRAEDAGARRLRTAKTSKAGMPIPAHAFIAAEGGMSKAAGNEFRFGKNPRVGNRSLFAARGGMSLEQATEKLVEAGYLREGASHTDAIALIRKSFTTPQYTAEGYEWQVQQEAEARRMAAEDAQDPDVQELADLVETLSDQELDAVVQNDDDVIWDAPGEPMTEADADRIFGAYRESNPEDAAPAAADEEGDARAAPPGADARDAQAPRPDADPDRTQALTPVTRPAGLTVTFGGKTYPVDSVEDAAAKWEEFRDRLMQEGSGGVSEIGNGVRVLNDQGREVARISYNGRITDSLLAAPTRQDVLEQQDRAARAAELDERAQIGREAEGFQLQGESGESREDNTGDMFGGPTADDVLNARAARPGAAPAGPDLFSGETEEPAGKIDDFGEKIGGARKDTAGSTGARSPAAKTDDIPGWRKRFISMQDVEGGKWHVMDLKTGRPMRDGYRVVDYENEAAAEAAVPLAAVALKHRVTSSGDEFVIMRDVTDRKRIQVVKQAFPTRDAAMRYLAVNAEEILATKTSFGEEILVKPESVMRKGAERRTGPATPKMFSDTFGFRGVEFGNWNNQEERQEVMNHAFDGMLDLAQLLGVPPRALSLGGDLGLAFGARGQGLSGARAHYERDYGVINLTKMSGAGSLAHEWFHGLDHYLARQDGKAAAGRQPNERGDMAYPTRGVSRDLQSHGPSVKSNMRAELRDAYEKLLRTMFRKAEQYVEDTERATKFVKATADDVADQLKSIRENLAQQLNPEYYKRMNKPATAEQLAAFDILADRLAAGENLPLTWKTNEKSRGFSGRWTNDTLEQISAILKAVRGRNGFTADGNGTMNRLSQSVRRYEERAQMLASAAAAETKTKMVPTEFAMDAKRIDQGRATDYWTTPHEMAARAFSAYVEDKVQADGGRSDFLSFGSDNNLFEYRLLGVRPFPEGADRAAINEAFDQFFDTVQTREDEGGNVTMFSRKAGNRRGAGALEEQAVTDYAGYATDLFGDPLPQRPASRQKAAAAAPRSDDTAPPAGDYYVRTMVSKPTTRTLGAARIKTPQDLAAATSYLYKSAVERFDAIVTDASGRPLAVVGGFKGALSQASIYPATIVAEAIRVPGAKHIWFSHNHPSGNSTLSEADLRMNDVLAGVFEGTGIQTMGVMAVSRSTFSHSTSQELGPRDITQGDIVAGAESVKVPVYERELSDDRVLPLEISSPATARTIAEDFHARAKEPGLLLLDAQNRVAAWVPLSGQMLGRLRNTGGLASLYRAISEPNAAAAVMVHAGELDAQPFGSRSTVANNIAVALKRIDVRPLDSINVKEPRSSAERGVDLGNGPLFSMTTGSAPMSPDPAATPLYEALRQVARLEGAFQLGTSDATELAKIAADMQPGHRQAFTADTGTALHQGNRKPVLTLRIEDERGVSQKMLDIFDFETDRPFVVIGNSELGQDRGGARAYQIAFAWAHNNGKVMRPDPAGLTVINRLRRSEAMISSAMRFGTTRHLEPHHDQYLALAETTRRRGKEPEDTHFSGDPELFNELEALKAQLWTVGDGADTIAANVQHLVEASAQLALLREPALRDLEVVDAELRRAGVDDTVPLGDVPTEEPGGSINLAGVVLRPASSGVGRTTALRTVIARSVSRAISDGQVAPGGNDGQDGGGRGAGAAAAIRAIRQVLGRLSGRASGLLAGSLYSRENGATAQGVSLASLQSMVTRLGRDWKNAPATIAVATEADLPQAIQDTMRSAGAEGQVEGVFHDGRVYLVAENLTDATRAEFVWAHEVLGHYGLRGLFKDKAAMDAALEAIWQANPAVQYRSLKMRRDFGYDRATSIEEAISDLAGEYKPLKGMNKLLKAIQDALRAIGLNGLADWLDSRTGMDKAAILSAAMTPNLRTLLEQSRAYVRGGAQAPRTTVAPVSLGMQPALASRGEVGVTETAAFRKWFGDSKVVDAEGEPLVMYHGTAFDDINAMYPGERGTIHFTSDPKMASGYATDRKPDNESDPDAWDAWRGDSPNVMPVYLRVEKPFDPENEAHQEALGGLRNLRGDWETLEQYADKIKALGFDGVMIDGMRDVAVFSPEQIKSATGNSGAYDGSNPDIRFNRDAGTLDIKNHDAWSIYQERSAQVGDGYVRWIEDPDMVHIIDIQAGPKMRGRRILERLKAEVGKPMQAVGVVENAQEFWDRMEEQGLIDSQTDEDFMTYFGRGSNQTMFSRTKMAGNSARQHTAAQLRAMKSVGFQVEEPTLQERVKALWQDAGKKMAQGIVDQFAPIKDLDQKAYGLARLSKGASGAFEALLQGGRLKLTDGVYDFDDTARGGVVDQLLIPLQSEHQDFMRWVAANRAERLKGEGKENLFTDQDIADLKTLSQGTTPFDYTVRTGPAAGRVTRDRSLIYADSLRIFNGFNKNVLDMAEQSGLIDGASRKVWEHEFYVPFYRVADEEDGGIRGGNVKGGLMRQAAFKELKGGKNALNADLLDNTLMNWAHLLDAAAKNRAAKATIEAAERMGVAAPGNQSTLKSMATSIGNKHGIVWFMDQGEKRFSLVDDPYILTALNSLEYAGMRNPVMNAMSTMKHVLTVGVTASPFFKIRNLIRDSVQVIGTSGIGANPLANISQGWKLTDPKSDEYFRLLAGGGTIHFGSMLEGSEAKRIQELVDSGVEDSTILSDQSKVQAFYRNFIKPGVDAYNELGNRGESVNRASLYAQLRRQGMNHADASLQARDLMDFSMQGSFTSIRFLTQVVPFLNARLQGLYKLGRAAKEDPARMAAVLGAVSLVSLSLLAAYGDDDDWKKREEWDRNNNWWFKFGGTAFRIPKPFELGAIATLAERGFELAFDKEMTSERFRKQVLTLLSDNLSMNPVPQLVKPLLDIYSNKDSFSGRPIETLSMEKLKSEYRFNDRTTMTARAASTAMNSVTGLVGAEALSPVQIDHMLRGYFGWLGSFVVGAGDVIARPATSQPQRAAPDYWKTATGGMVAGLEGASSRYVSQMYEQAKTLEQAYGTYRALKKEGKGEEAAAFAEQNRDQLGRYQSVERVKKAQSALNERVRVIERSAMDPEAKREAITRIREQQDRLARQLVN